MSDVKADLKSRMDELQIFIPKIYQPNGNTNVSNTNIQDPFQGLNIQHLPDELLSITFYRQQIGRGQNGHPFHRVA